MNSRDYDEKFYMQRYVDGSWEPEVSIEDSFDGLRYMSCKGLSSFGKVKNIYTETYAETDRLRIDIPKNVARENTDLEFEFVFLGENRRGLFHDFVGWLSGHRIRFWDTLRNRECEMVLMDAVEPKQDNIKDGIKYIIVPFKFKNLNGQTKRHI